MHDATREPEHGQSHPPTDPADQTETREETIDRVLTESRQGEIEDEHGGTLRADPSTRRGLNRFLHVYSGLGFLAGMVLGVGVTLLANFTAPAALGEPGAGQLVAACIIIGAALGIVAWAVVALVVLEREDGTVERQVEEDLGPQPSPAEPIERKHDLTA